MVYDQLMVSSLRRLYKIHTFTHEWSRNSWNAQTFINVQAHIIKKTFKVRYISYHNYVFKLCCILSCIVAYEPQECVIGDQSWDLLHLRKSPYPSGQMLY